MNYKGDFFNLLEKIKRKENFAYVRYSDGEAIVMQNKKLVLAQDRVEVADDTLGFGYSDQDHKEFIPEKHGFVKDRLLASYKFKASNYFVGSICESCDCASKEYALWMQEQYGSLDQNYTSANLLVNGNYADFITYFVPELKGRKNVIICNKNATFEKLPFEVVKDFRVGQNCIVNDHHLIDEIKTYIDQNHITNHVFLFSASSLSEILIHQLYAHNNQNTYIDIGTTLHPYLNLEIAREYLKAYWKGYPHPNLYKECQ